MGQKCFVTLKRLFESDKEKLNGEFVIKVIVSVPLCFLCFLWRLKKSRTMNGNENAVQSVPAISKASCAAIASLYSCFMFKLQSSQVN